uniref:Uncharacterized protein n=1 Tax=Acrobeloides nanus TaxID=290746 RepID=A0A914E7W1_9BILA
MQCNLYNSRHTLTLGYRSLREKWKKLSEGIGLSEGIEKLSEDRDIERWSDEKIIDYTKKLTAEKWLITTPLCEVSFTKEGYGYSFMVPTDFDPSRVVSSKDPFERLFEESHLISKPFMKHGTRWSLHDILCDIYDCDPENTLLSDEPLIMLPLWDIGCTHRHIRNYSDAIHNAFVQAFSGNLLNSWPNNPVQAYIPLFTTQVEKKICSRIYDNPKGHCLEQIPKSGTKNEDVQRAMILCSFRGFLKQFKVSLFHDASKLQKKDVLCVLSYYDRVFEALLLSLRELEKRLKGKFSEVRKGQFDKIVKIGIEYWKDVWFCTDFLPKTIRKIYDMKENSGVDKSHLITVKLISSYYTLGIFNGPTNVINANRNLSLLEYYNFIQWHVEYFKIARDDRFLKMVQSLNKSKNRKRKACENQQSNGFEVLPMQLGHCD